MASSPSNQLAGHRVNGNQQQAQPQISPASINWLTRYKYDKRKTDEYNDMRTVLLVVSALIAAVTFQAGVNPPGGVWQDSNGHVAGNAIYSTHKKPFYVFLVFNTLALSASISVIISLTYMFPFSVEIWIATVSMIITYGSSVFAITPHHSDYKFRYLLITAAFPLVARFVVQVCRYLKRRMLWNIHVQLLPIFRPSLSSVDIFQIEKTYWVGLGIWATQ